MDSSNNQLSVIRAIQAYILKMVKSTDGMKVLLMDDETTTYVSMVLSQSDLLKEQVYLFEKLSVAEREEMVHLKAICFVRPTEENQQLLKEELKKPKYGAYHLFFSNAVSDKYLEELAASDQHEVVQEVHEYFADYIAVNHEAWTLNIKKCLTSNAFSSIGSPKLQRIVDGLFSCFLSFKLRPTVRYQKDSSLSNQVAVAFKARLESSNLLKKDSGSQPLLIIMDRNEDPITPLLTAWTYQAMLHQHIGIHNNLINLPSNDNKSNQIVVSALQDNFYEDNMFLDFGDLGDNIKRQVDVYQRNTQSNKKIESIEDMKKFVESYPEFKKQEGSTLRHMALMEKLQTVVQKKQLLTVSMVEQELACTENHSDAAQHIRDLLDKDIELDDALRVVALYAIRYEADPSYLKEFTKLLISRFGATRQDVDFITTLLKLAGRSKRSQGVDLLGNNSTLDNWTKRFKRNLVGVQNVYTQHEPLLKKIVEAISKKQLDEKSYPYIVGQAPPGKSMPPTDIFIFIIGGITYEEAAFVHKLNTMPNAQNRVILGGTCILKPDEFIAEVNSGDSEKISLHTYS